VKKFNTLMTTKVIECRLAGEFDEICFSDLEELLAMLGAQMIEHTEPIEDTYP
jgi:hypothetical protein